MAPKNEKVRFLGKKNQKNDKYEVIEQISLKRTQGKFTKIWTFEAKKQAVNLSSLTLTADNSQIWIDTTPSPSRLCIYESAILYYRYSSSVLSNTEDLSEVNNESHHFWVFLQS